MFWVLVLAGIALVGLVVLVAHAVWLAHKTADVWSEVSVLADRAAQVGGLLATIGAPPPTAVTAPPDLTSGRGPSVS